MSNTNYGYKSFTQSVGSIAGTVSGRQAVSDAKQATSFEDRRMSKQMSLPGTAQGSPSESPVGTVNMAGQGIPENDGFKLDFTGKSLASGLIMSEILSRPRCLRRGRW